MSAHIDQEAYLIAYKANLEPQIKLLKIGLMLAIALVPVFSALDWIVYESKFLTLIVSDTLVLTPDGNQIRRVEVRLDPADSIYFAASGGYAAFIGVRERITVGAPTTTVLYAQARRDGVSNPDQVPNAPSLYGPNMADVSSWQRDTLSPDSAYGRCTTNCTLLLVQPGYDDPEHIIVRDTHRYITGTHPGLEVARTASHTIAEDRLNTDAGAPASIRSGANMRLDIGSTLTNRFADIQAGAVLSMPNANATIVNEGQTLKRVHSFLNTTHTAGQGSFSWTAADITETIGQVGGTLSGAQQLNITARSLTNTDLARSSGLALNNLAPGSVNFLGAPTLPTTDKPLAVPRSALLNTAAPTAGYLIQTEPRLISYRTWLGSDYLINSLGRDPNSLQKRLGDGFYEQRLVREQVAQLTGRRYLQGYANDEAQFRALMDSGAAFAQQWNLIPGVALSAAQMAALTTDLVWLVQREVSLPDGTITTALVPQVYLRQVPEGDFPASGALLAGDRVALQIGEDLVNAGGRIEGGVVIAEAGRDLTNIGGLIQARSELLASAGRNVTISSPTYTTSFKGSYVNQDRTELAAVGSMRVGNSVPGSSLTIQAGQDVVLQGASVSNASSEGATRIQAGRNIELSTVGVASSENTEFNALNYRRHRESSEVGTNVQAQGDLSLVAGNDLAARATNVQAQGDLSALAGNDIRLEAGRQVKEDAGSVYTQSKNIARKKSTEEVNYTFSDVAIGTDLGGKTVTLQSGQDINVKGSRVIGDQGVDIHAARDVNLEPDQNRSSELHFRENRRSGIGSSGAGFSIGKSQQSTDLRQQSTSTADSTIGAITGDVNITAGRNYRQQGSDVLAPAGDVNVQAQRIEITEARESSQTRVEQKQKQSGVSIALSGGGVDAVQSATRTVDAMGDTDNARMKALGAATLALTAVNTANQVSEALANGASPTEAAGVSLNISIGSSKSQATSQRQSDSARGSTVTAGGSVNLRAQGAGEQSDTLVQGSTIQAGNTVRLQAQDDVQLLAAKNTSTQQNQNSSKSGSVGVSLGAQTGVTLGASRGKGQGSGDETLHSNTYIEAGQRVQIQSGKDTTLQGAVIKAPQVQANVGGDLKIQSLQDTSTYQERNRSAGGSVTIGPSPGGSVSVGKTKIDSNYLSAQEQSGIRAGDGGFQVSVDGKTELIGGAITSTQAAVDASKNAFSSQGGLELRDLQNKAEYQASGYSVSAGVSSGKPNGGAGIGSDRGKAESTTQAAISGIAGNKDARTGDPETGIAPIFDQDRVRQEVNAQITITAEFGKQASQAVGDYASSRMKEAEGLRIQAQGEADPTKRAELTAQADKLEADWGDNGQARLLAHTVVGGFTGGAAGAAGAAVGTLAAPQVAETLAQAGVDPALSKAITSIASTAAGAAVGGTAGAAAAFNEVQNNYLKHADVQKLADKLKTCGTDQACREAAFEQAYRTSVANDIELLNCQTTDNCGALKAEFRKGYESIAHMLDVGISSQDVGRILNLETNAQTIIRNGLDQLQCNSTACQNKAQQLVGIGKGLAKVTPAGLVTGSGVMAYELTTILMNIGLTETATLIAQGVTGLPADVRERLSSKDPQVRGEAMVDALSLTTVAAAVTAKLGQLGYSAVVKQVELAANGELPFSRLVPGGGLAVHEATGGHLLARHVGQTQSDLAARLVAQPRLGEVSTFANRAEAEAAISIVLDTRAVEVNAWIAGGARGRLIIDAAFDGGTVLQRGAAAVVPGTGVRAVLEGTGGGGWRIITGYPTP